MACRSCVSPSPAVTSSAKKPCTRRPVDDGPCIPKLAPKAGHSQIQMGPKEASTDYVTRPPTEAASFNQSEPRKTLHWRRTRRRKYAYRDLNKPGAAWLGRPPASARHNSDREGGKEEIAGQTRSVARQAF